MKKFIYYLSILSIVLPLLSSCYPMDDNYAWLADNGPIVYLNRADTTAALGGREKINIKWFKQWDNRSKTAKITWNGGKESVDIDLAKNPTEYVIKDLPEGVYSFELYFYGDNGLKSCATSIVGKSYGLQYEKFLLNRQIKVSIPTTGENEVQFDCRAFTAAGYIGSELIYTDNNNIEKTIKITSKEAQTIRVPKESIKDAASGAVFKFRSLYIPEPEGFSDIFYSQWESTPALPITQ